MKQLLLNISEEQDVQWLIPMLTRLGIHVSEAPPVLSEEEIAYHRRIIERGGKEKPNFEAFLKDFENSREDRSVTFPE